MMIDLRLRVFHAQRTNDPPQGSRTIEEALVACISPVQQSILTELRRLTSSHCYWNDEVFVLRCGLVRHGITSVASAFVKKTRLLV
jgi:hypothetical protein